MAFARAVQQNMESLGAKALDGISAAFELLSLFLATLQGVFRGERPKGEVAKQLHVIGNRSVLFICVTLGFIGMVMIYQMCLQVSRIMPGQMAQVGPEFLKLLVHDLAPTLTAMMLATRVGAGIAAEIGSMKVTEQVDALRMSGVAPINYLIVPRFIACVVMMVVLSIIGGVVAYIAGGLAASGNFGVNLELFFDTSRVNFTHLGLGLSKAIAYGIAIPIISGFCGLRAQGSSEGVGWATTAAVIGSSLAIIVLDFLISAFGLIFLGAGL